MAGPEVFLKNADEIKEAKRKIAQNAGISPLFPLDNVVRDLFSRKDLTEEKKGLIVYRANELLMQKANGTIPNITPWQGPHMDVGTAFEVGYTKALGKPIEAYTNSPLPFVARQRLNFRNQDISINTDTFGVERDAKEGIMLENFGPTVSENIMIDGSTKLSGGMVSRAKNFKEKVLSGVDLYKSLEQFKKAADRMAEGFTKGTYAAKAQKEENALKPFLTELDL